MEYQIIYIHGKGGRPQEAEHYRKLFPDCRVVGLDYEAAAPWEAQKEFPALFDLAVKGREPVALIANSIGAYYAMCALGDRPIEKAWFISPVVDMECLILKMMGWAGITEQELRVRKTVETNFGEILSWEYLTYVRSNPVRWEIPTEILYGSGDHLVSYHTVAQFAAEHGCCLTVMEGGEHWFHTDQQMIFLDKWLQRQ